MLTSIGGAHAPASDAVDLLIECHERIRSFATLALRLATERAPLEEVEHAAGSVSRYFRDAFPLHEQDEERSLLPRLRGRDQPLERALDAMCAEHRGHQAAVAEVIAQCDALQRAPEQQPERAAALGRAAERLSALLLQHLAPEEALVFPAVRRLPAEERQAILDEIRARRQARP